MADRARIEQLSKERGSEDLQAALDFIMGFAGPGAIKRVFGVPGVGVKLKGKQISDPEKVKPRESGRTSPGQRLAAALNKRSNINRPAEHSAAGVRRNIGGKRPPDTELEALALQKQEIARKVAQGREVRRSGLREQTKAAEGGKASLEKAEREARKKHADAVLEGLIELTEDFGAKSTKGKVANRVVELRRNLLRLSDEALSGRLQGALNKVDLSRLRDIQQRLKALQGLERDAKAIEKSMRRQVRKRHKRGTKPQKEPKK